MGLARNLTVIALALGFSAAAISGQTVRRGIGVVYERPSAPLPDFSLVTLLDQRLAVANGLAVFVPEDDTLAPAPNRRFDLDSLTAWGVKTGCRYVLYLRVDRRDIATRKQPSIPFILTRYVVEGRLTGMYMLIDVDKGRLVGKWPLQAKVTGPRRWQAADDYPDDPDLFLTAPRRLELLRTLEETAADNITATVLPHLRGR
jgi:hypothetical protein